MIRDSRHLAFIILAFAFLSAYYFQSSVKTSSVILDIKPAAAAPVNGAPIADVHRSPLKEAPFPGFPIDLNAASIGELKLLPGVGEKTAARIIEKRAELNGFRSVDELTEVKWIGKVKLEKIRPFVTIKGGPKAPARDQVSKQSASTKPL